MNPLMLQETRTCRAPGRLGSSVYSIQVHVADIVQPKLQRKIALNWERRQKWAQTVQSEKWADGDRREPLSLGIQLQIWPLALEVLPPTSIFILSLQHWNVNIPLLASPLWIFRQLQPGNLSSASPHNCSGWGGIPQLNDTCSAAHLRAMGRTPRACSVKKEHFIARDYKPGTLAKCFHYITIATHVSGNSTYKAWWIEISEIIMQSAF